MNTTKVLLIGAALASAATLTVAQTPATSAADAAASARAAPETPAHAAAKPAHAKKHHKTLATHPKNDAKAEEPTASATTSDK